MYKNDNFDLFLRLTNNQSSKKIWIINSHSCNIFIEN